MNKSNITSSSFEHHFLGFLVNFSFVLTYGLDLYTLYSSRYQRHDIAGSSLVITQEKGIQK
jgi:hypoxanthine-guanine phosphoribosyltransferase